MITLLSNNSDDGLTPEGLRRLGSVQQPQRQRAMVTEPRIHRLSSRLSTSRVAEVVSRYEAGESATSLAKEFDVAPSALLRLLREHNVVVRKQGVGSEKMRAIAREYEAGATVAELEKKYELSHGAVLRALHRAGVEMRAKAPRPNSERSITGNSPAVTVLPEHLNTTFAARHPVTIVPNVCTTNNTYDKGRCSND